MSEERSDYLQVRCEVWWMPDLEERAYELRFTPAGVKIHKHWEATKDVYYLRRNYERFMTIRPWTWEERYRLRVHEVERGEILKDDSTDGQVVDEVRRRTKGPNVKSQPDHQVNLQGVGVITKGVPADREIQFFGLPDYQEKEEGETEEYGDYEYYDGEGSGEEEEEDGGGGGGMSNLEKALLAAELGICLLYTSPSPRD